LQNIFDISENQLPENSFDFSMLNNEQKIYKMKELVKLSVQDRQKYIERTQIENKKFRLSLLQIEDNYTQSLIFEKCRRDVLFYINSFIWTYNPRLQQSNLPFITYPFQDKTILELVNSIEV
jgi:hypothetical protein